MGLQIENPAVGSLDTVCPGFKVWLRSFLAAFLLVMFLPVAGRAGLDVMTNHELSEQEGGHLIEMAIADDFYATDPDITVVRFSSDIYLESYGEIGALKLGNYPRTVSELGDMVSMDSNYTMVYGPQDRSNPINGSTDRTYVGTGGDTPYEPPHANSTSNRIDRIHDRYGGTDSGGVRIGQQVYLRSSAPPQYFGSDQCTTHPETQWDINWENLQMGVSADYPMRIYGLILRAEFSGWGTSNQMLRRFVIGSNKLYGYSSARPLVTSGWLCSEMTKLEPRAYALTNQVAFQLQRDPLMDQYWALSSFSFNPDNRSAGSFRQFWFNTDMSQVLSGNPNNDVSNYVGSFNDRDHGFFLMVDVTDRRFSGWNLIGGVNEYRNWPPLEQDPDHYFESEYITWHQVNVD